MRQDPRRSALELENAGAISNQLKLLLICTIHNKHAQHLESRREHSHGVMRRCRDCRLSEVPCGARGWREGNRGLDDIGMEERARGQG